MHVSLRERLTVLYGWPRGLAALLCLVLAAASALGAGTAPPDSAARSQSLTTRLGPGQVLVPVTLAGRAEFLRAGDRVDLLAAAADTATAAEIGAGLLVVQVSPPAAGALSADGGTRLLVAASRPAAAKIAAVPSGRVVAVLDKQP
ncbi:MAG: hypothetical protein EPN43_06890 [Jatrophihabitans sp.]|nr:MAG: hypothetical protein EPN43_06890 [Jatrophihabitans sp.]